MQPMEEKMATDLQHLMKQTDVPKQPTALIERRSAVGRILQKLSTLTGLEFIAVPTDEKKFTNFTNDGRGASKWFKRIPENVFQWARALSTPDLYEIERGIYYAVPLRCFGFQRYVALGFFVLPGPFNHDPLKHDKKTLTTAEIDWLAAELREASLPSPPNCHSQTNVACILRRLLYLAWQHLQAEQREQELKTEIVSLSEEIDRTYEEISLLHDLARNLSIAANPCEVFDLCLDRLQELIAAEEFAVCLKLDGKGTHFLTAGQKKLSKDFAIHLIDQLLNDHPGPVVANHLQEKIDGRLFADLQNLVAAPIAEGSHSYGWLFCCNAKDGREFGSVEAALLQSIATILGTYLRNLDLYNQHRELVFSFVRSLVSALDARDPYTRGHSERVALIAKRLGEELGLSTTELDTLYRAGLLHDIGKVGVDDRILRKQGRLTEQEFEHIRQHSMIGYLILAELKNLQDVLPGVRHHHENYTGGGYPDGLVGEEIPLIARIIAVADAYDAMRSDRLYRKGMPLERIEQIFRERANKQWDGKIIQAYFRAREDIDRIFREYSPTLPVCQLAKNHSKPNEG